MSLHNIVNRDVFLGEQTSGEQIKCFVSMLRKQGNICCGHTMFLEEIRNIFYKVRTSHGKPGKSWNFRISFSRPGKWWKLRVAHGKSWKMMFI